MTGPNRTPPDPDQRAAAARDTARREAHRLARDAGAQIVTRPMFTSAAEPTTRDVEPLTGARAARELELAARRAARDYIRQAREAGHGWHQIAQLVGLTPGADEPGATPADTAYDYAAGRPDPKAPGEPRYFAWTCRSCDQHIRDHGLAQGPADDEQGHADGCPRLVQAVADWDTSWEIEP